MLPIEYPIDEVRSGKLEVLGGGTTPPTPFAKLRCQDPPKASELTNWEQYHYSLDTKLAVELGFPIVPVGGISGQGRQRVVVMEFSRSARCTATEGTEVDYGVSVRLVVHLSNFEVGANLALPYIAAQVQFGSAQAESYLRVRGYKGNDLAPLIPSPKAFNVDTYAELMQKVAEIQELIGRDTKNVKPELLRLAEPGISDENEIDNAFGIVWALSKLADGKPLNAAKRELQLYRANDDAALSAVESTYATAVGGDTEGDTVPDQAAINWARDRVGELRLRQPWWS